MNLKARQPRLANFSCQGLHFQVQRIFLENSSREIPDDALFASLSLRVQLVVSEYWPLESLDAEQRQNMLSALRDNDLVSLERCLQRPQDPEIGYLEAALLLEAKAKIDQLDFPGGTPLWIVG